MSVVDPDYLKAVEDHFVALRGKGYALSGRDVGRVLTWQSDGVPLAVVLRALDEEARKRGPSLGRDPRPLTLGSFARTVRDGARTWAERNVQVDAAAGSAAPGTERFESLRAALVQDDVADTAIQGILHEATRALDALARDARSVWSAASELDAQITHKLLALLSREELVALEASVRSLVDPRMSDEAQAEKLDVEIAAALRKRFRAPHLLQVLLDGD